MSHTPGPWAWDAPGSLDPYTSETANRLSAPNDETVLSAFANYELLMKPEDARLIAAAPALLEACRALLAYDANDQSDSFAFMKLYADAVDAARAAVAKATGSQIDAGDAR